MKFETINIESDLTIIGGGMPGICAAIQAARLGLKVALINNRGYLGGNASPEIRIDICGADGANEFNFYARETGILEELRLENFYRNPQGNVYLWHDVLLDWVLAEKNIQLFLNTNIDEVVTDDNKKITYVAGSQLGSEKHLKFISDLFVDDTGDGSVGYLAGSEYRIGMESRDEFSEAIAPLKKDQATLLSTLSFYTKDTGRKAPFTLPNYVDSKATKDALQFREIPDRIPGHSRYENYRMQWFYETGYGRDSIAESEEIIHDHRELVNSVWDHIKHSGHYESENFDFEYVSSVPGKRESRRLVGDHILTENDLVNQVDFVDVIGHGGWSIDLHAKEGFFSDDMTTHHYNLNGVYGIPLKSCYSKDVENLFVASRCMSTTHVAFGSTRVMGTLSTVGQAVGSAAYLCHKYNTTPRVVANDYINELQQELLCSDQHILGHKNEDTKDLIKNSIINVSSIAPLTLDTMTFSQPLSKNYALILPIKNNIGSLDLLLTASKDTSLTYSIYTSNKKQNYNPYTKIGEHQIDLSSSKDFQWVSLALDYSSTSGKLFIELHENESIEMAFTEDKLNGVITLRRQNYTTESTYVDINTHEVKTQQWGRFEHSLVFRLEESTQLYAGDNINNGYNRNHILPNLWLSEANNDFETINIQFKQETRLSRLNLTFDSNLNFYYDNLEIYYDHNVVPELVKDYKVYANLGNEQVLLADIKDNHHRVNHLTFDSITTDELTLVLETTNGSKRFGVYEIRAYED